MAIVLCAWQAASASSRVARALGAALLPALALTVYLTSSRGALVALAIGLGIGGVSSRGGWVCSRRSSSQPSVPTC